MLREHQADPVGPACVARISGLATFGPALEWRRPIAALGPRGLAKRNARPYVETCRSRAGSVVA